MKKLLKVIAMACCVALPAQASSVFLVGDSNVFTTAEDNEIFFQNVFNGKSVASFGSLALGSLGTTATISQNGNSAITAANLAGNDFLLFGHSRSSITAAELAAVADFHNNGGSIFLAGEGASAFNALNTAVNSILSAIGSTMSLSLNQSDNFDVAGFTTLTNFTANGPLLNGVNSWTTAFASGISLGANGQAILSGTADAAFGTAIGFEGAAVNPVPLPAGLPLVLSGALILGWVGRRKTA